MILQVVVHRSLTQIICQVRDVSRQQFMCKMKRKKVPAQCPKISEKHDQGTHKESNHPRIYGGRGSRGYVQQCSTDVFV